MNPPVALLAPAQHQHEHAPATDHDHAHHHHHHHGPGHSCCAHHDSTESDLKRRLFFVFAAVICLAIGGWVRFSRPEQADLAALWSLLGAVLGALPIYRDTLAGLQSKASENTEFYMNQFMTLAVTACLVSGQYLTGGIVAVVLLVGHILEDRSMLGASEAINSLLNLSRSRARRLAGNDTEEEIDAESLAPGDRISVRPGDTIPADGRVQTGHSTVNQASITGESFPVEVAEGANVFAGTTNITGLLQIEVTRTGGQTVLGRVQQIVSEAQSTRAPIVRLTEEYARYYMPVVLLIAGAVLFFTHDLQRAISVIIVSIPCTFVMAGPTAMVAALASASRLGILIKSVRFFEAANDIDTIVFDKTGTLSTGELHVARIVPAGDRDANKLLLLVAALEQHSTHPVARALVKAARKIDLSLAEAANVKEEHGLGVTGNVGGENIQTGRRAWLKAQGIAGLPEDDLFPHFTAISVAVSGNYAGTLYLGDTLRDETTGLKQQLEDEGIEHFLMLTGDRPSVARETAARLGITEFQAECLPAQKREAIEQLKRAGHHVLVVGDGVNDAPALAAGHLSMAMGSLGSDVAIQTADIALMSSDLRRTAHFLSLSNQAFRIVNQNILCGLTFIGLTVVLSSAGYLPPIAAAFVHELGAFFVIFNSARLLRFEGKAS